MYENVNLYRLIGKNVIFMQSCVILPDTIVFIQLTSNVIRNNCPGGDLPDEQ